MIELQYECAFFLNKKLLLNSDIINNFLSNNDEL